jgi:hypothetical protein
MEWSGVYWVACLEEEDDRERMTLTRFDAPNKTAIGMRCANIAPAAMVGGNRLLVGYQSM